MERLDLNGNGPCPCGVSSDAFHVYPDGHGYCFSGNCTRNNKYVSERELMGKPHSESRPDEVYTADKKFTYQYLDWRGVSRHTWEKYQTQFKISGETPVEVGFKYADDHHKVRFYDRKSFYQTGKVKPGVYGKLAFPVGSFTDIIITEGEVDAASAYEMVGGKVAAVSVQSSSSAIADILADFEYINSAKRLFICFDSDKAGQDAAAKVVKGKDGKFFDFHKLFRIELDVDLKDANGYLVAQRAKDFRSAYSGASKFTPDGVISSYDEVMGVLGEQQEKSICSFPFRAVEDKLQGLRYGVSYLFSGLEGIGKTEILRALEYHVLKETDENIGIIHLEENKSSTINNLLTQPYRYRYGSGATTRSR